MHEQNKEINKPKVMEIDMGGKKLTVLGGITDDKGIQHWACGCKVDMKKGRLTHVCDACIEKGITMDKV